MDFSHLDLKSVISAHLSPQCVFVVKLRIEEVS